MSTSILPKRKICNPISNANWKGTTTGSWRNMDGRSLRQRSLTTSDLAKEEDIDEKALVKYVQEYDYLQREKPEILQRAIKQKKGLRLLQRSWLLRNLTTKLRNIISTFGWE